MSRFRCVVFFLSHIAALVCLQDSAQGNPTAIQNRPNAFVSSLYNQVVARHPLGIPYGVNKRIFAPYLSKKLLHRFDLNGACFSDWRSQNPDPNLKPPIGMIEDGIFSGGDEKADPKSFHIERTERENGGSFRVYVQLIWQDPLTKPLIWYVAVVVVPEDGHLVVDNVSYLKNKVGDVESSLSEDLSSECVSGHWIGNSLHPR